MEPPPATVAYVITLSYNCHNMNARTDKHRHTNCQIHTAFIATQLVGFRDANCGINPCSTTPMQPQICKSQSRASIQCGYIYVQPPRCPTNPCVITPMSDHLYSVLHPFDKQ
jgi:hypothetical protein